MDELNLGLLAPRTVPFSLAAVGLPRVVTVNARTDLLIFVDVAASRGRSSGSVYDPVPPSCLVEFNVEMDGNPLFAPIQLDVPNDSVGRHSAFTVVSGVSPGNHVFQLEAGRKDCSSITPYLGNGLHMVVAQLG